MQTGVRQEAIAFTKIELTSIVAQCYFTFKGFSASARHCPFRQLESPETRVEPRGTHDDPGVGFSSCGPEIAMLYILAF